MSTVGELLKPTHVVEFRHVGGWRDGGWAQAMYPGRYRSWSNAMKEWGWWVSGDGMTRHEVLSAPARLVPIAEADADPNTRGEL